MRRIPTEIATLGSLWTVIFFPKRSKGNSSHEDVIQLSENGGEKGIYWSGMENKRSGKPSRFWKRFESNACRCRHNSLWKLARINRPGWPRPLCCVNGSHWICSEACNCLFLCHIHFSTGWGMSLKMIPELICSFPQPLGVLWKQSIGKAGHISLPFCLKRALGGDSFLFVICVLLMICHWKKALKTTPNSRNLSFVEMLSRTGCSKFA